MGLGRRVWSYQKWAALGALGLGAASACGAGDPQGQESTTHGGLRQALLLAELDAGALEEVGCSPGEGCEPEVCAPCDAGALCSEAAAESGAPGAGLRCSGDAPLGDAGSFRSDAGCAVACEGPSGSGAVDAPVFREPVVAAPIVEEPIVEEPIVGEPGAGVALAPGGAAGSAPGGSQGLVAEPPSVNLERAALGAEPLVTTAKPGPVSEACQEGFYPTHQSAFGDRVCAEGRPCADDAAWDWGGAGADGSCRTCPRCFGESQGGTGRPYPYRDRNGQCVCESLPNFFATPGLGSGLAPCDADGDGWVRQSAERFMAPLESQVDAAHQLNARCEVREVDTVFLVNEYNQGLEVPVSEPSLGLNLNVLPLYEPDANDSPELFEECAGSRACSPQYGARSLRAKEVNSFTKACVTPAGDFNANGVDDVLENEQSFVPVASQKRFAMFSHYVELHDSEYQPPEEGREFGSYVIRERSRCQASFPLGYAAPETEYWRQCTRRRPPAFSLGESTAATGFDFGRFSCESSEGGCGAPLPPVKGFGEAGGTPFVLEPGLVDPENGEQVEHGLCLEQERPFQLCQLDGRCAVEGSFVPGLTWRGMQHHSQFRCVVLGDVEEGHAAVSPELVAPWGGSEAPYEANECGLLAPSDSAGRNPSSVPAQCSLPPVSAPRPAVSWVARRYMGEPGYNEGCVDEAQEPNFLKLCPGGATAGASTSLRPFGHPDRFGLLLCGCDPEVGGPACDVGCPGDRVHFGGAANAESCVDDSYLVNGYCALTPEGRREGFWLCGDTAASVVESPEGALEPAQEARVGETSVRLTGGVPTMPVMDAKLQAALSCDEQRPCPFDVPCNEGTCSITVRADSTVGR